MTDAPNTARIRITNCHIHTFTAKHTPFFFPAWYLIPFKLMPLLVEIAAKLIRGWFPGQAEWLLRLIKFRRFSALSTQAKIFEAVRIQYPSDTRFVVLPMDMELMRHGWVTEDLDTQHSKLFELADQHPGRIIPFCTVHPDRDDAAQRVERYLDQGARGLKIYPRLGYRPDHPVLMQRIYPMIAERGLPVMTHCSRGGVAQRGLGQRLGDEYSAPQAVIPVMQAFPDLRICLAHFGGQDDWLEFVKGRIDPLADDAARRNWMIAIRQMIESGDWENLYTDISYTLFFFDELAPFLKVFLTGEGDRKDRLRNRVLFGSDHYMSRNTAYAEREVSVRLRLTLGEDLFRQIAETNPDHWLGSPGA
ncbi:MAG: amidohydrolase family protein [Pseudomonadota bacterium]